MPAGALEGLLEGQVREQPLDGLVNLFDGRNLGTEHVEVAPQARIALDLVYQGLGLEQPTEVLVLVSADEAGNNGPAAATGQDVGQDALEPHRLDGTDVEEQQ